VRHGGGSNTPVREEDRREPGTRGVHARRGIDGRIVVLAAVALYGLTVATARAGWDVDLWPSLGVNSAPTLFYDARNVAAAADCWALGYDPLVENPCDPAGRVMVYPRVWVVVHYLGVTQDRTLWFGGILVALFLASVLLLVGRLSIAQGFVVAAAVVSPAVMFAVERGNVDILLFAVFVAAVFAWSARDKVTPLLSPSLIVVAAIAKLYAIFALPAYWFTGVQRARWAVVGGAAAMGAYLLLTFGDVRQLLKSPEGGLLYSYGARILIGDLYHRFQPETWAYGSLLAQLIAMIPVIVASVAIWVWLRRRLPEPSVGERVSQRTLAFHLGALTYLGTFLTRKSGDYRSVFVLLTLPLLLEWAWGDTAEMRTVLGRIGLVAVVAGLYVGALSPFIGPWDELASWAIAGAFVALLAATVPRWRGSGQAREGTTPELATDAG
jgi:Glycosyltransferase family 87